MAKQQYKRITVVNTCADGNNLLVGHYGNEELAPDKPKVTSADWPAYRLHYIIRGSVLLEYGNKTVALGGHTFFILRPDGKTAYTPDPTSATETYWVAFTGNAAGAYSDLLGLTPNAPYLELPAEYADAIKEIFAENFTRNLTEPLMRNALYLKNLLRLFDVIYAAQPHTDGDLARNASASSHIQRILDHVHKRFSDPTLTVTSAAEALNLNPDYLSKLFRKEMSVTFTRYVAQQRIEHAVALFQQGATSVSQTAYLCGFSDPLYFSKVFTTLNGISPRRCIEQNKPKYH